MASYSGWVLLHIIGVAGFLIAHGASAVLTLRLKKESDPARIRALLDLSGGTVAMMGISTLLLLVGGVVATFVGHYWGQVWPWAAIAVLVLMMGVMTPIAAKYFNAVREAAGAQSYAMKKKGIEAGEPDPERLATLLASNRPYAIAALGYGGLLVILWLMVYKP